MADKLLSIRDLLVFCSTPFGEVKALGRINLEIARGEAVGIIGNPYSGKSLVASSIMRTLPLSSHYIGRIMSGEILFQGENLLFKSEEELRDVRETKILTVFSSFQLPFLPTSMKVGSALTPEKMEMISSLSPSLVIADMSIQPESIMRQWILSLIKKKKEEEGSSLLLITEDLSSIIKLCDRIIIMYAGNIVERATVKTFLEKALHPYCTPYPFILGPNLYYDTFLEYSDIESLPIKLASIISDSLPATRRYQSINLINMPSGCRFHPNCPYATDRCAHETPRETEPEPGHTVACHLIG